MLEAPQATPATATALAGVAARLSVELDGYPVAALIGALDAAERGAHPRELQVWRGIVHRTVQAWIKSLGRQLSEFPEADTEALRSIKRRMQSTQNALWELVGPRGLLATAAA